MNKGIYSIFIRKWIENAKVQYGAIRMVVDWTIALYFVVPALLIGIYHYRAWLIEEPAWLAQVPPFVFWFVLAVNVCSGHVRWFLDEADALFVLQRQVWLKKLKLIGALYSIIKSACSMAILLIVLFPLLYREPMFQSEGMFQFERYFALFVLMSACQWLITAVKSYTHLSHPISRGVAKTVTWIIGFGSFVCILWAFHAGALTMRQLTVIFVWIVIMAFILLYQRAAKPYYFAADTEVDLHAKMQMAAIVLSQTVRKKGKWRLRKPWLFRHSKRLFAERSADHIFAEMVIKSFYRDSHKRNLYLRFIGAGSAAMMLTPMWFKPIVWGLLHLILIPIMNKHVKDIQASDFSEMMLDPKANEDVFYRSQSILSKWIHVPAFAVFTAIFLLSLFFYGLKRLLGV